MDLVFISYLGLTGDWCNYSRTEIEKGLFSPFSDVHQVKDTSRGIKKKKKDSLAEFLGFGWRAPLVTPMSTTKVMQRMLFQSAKNYNTNENNTYIENTTQ